MEDFASPYKFTRGQRGIFAEVYFPKKVVYQGEIFEALEDGLKEKLVREHLTINLRSILEEMAEYPQIFDPNQYTRTNLVDPLYHPSALEALRRIDQYISPFHGWSMYEVDGVFRNEVTGQLDDERTQVIRLIFRFEDPLKALAKEAGCYDVFEALMRWVMAEHNRLDHVLPWGDEEQNRFLKLHSAWPEHKQQFVFNHYRPIARSLKKWMDDIALFIYGYLVRRFWSKAVARGRQEDEIWVVSFFNMNLNIVKRQTRRESNDPNPPA